MEKANENSKNTNSNKGFSVLIFSIIFYILVFIQDYTALEKIYPISVKLTKNLSENYKWTENWQWLLTSGVQIFFIIFFIRLILNKDKIYLLRTIMFFCIISFISTDLKTYFHDPIPQNLTNFSESDTNDKIYESYKKMKNCSHDRGMPSAHTSLSLYILLNLLIQYLHRKDFYVSRVKLYSIIVLILFIEVNISLSRIYYGEHTLNQLLYGFSQSLLVAASENYFKKDIDKLFESFLNENPFKKDKKLLRTLVIQAFYGIAIIFHFYIIQLTKSEYEVNECQIKAVKSEYVLKGMLECQPAVFIIILYTSKIVYVYNENFYSELGLRGLVKLFIINLSCFSPIIIYVVIFMNKFLLDDIMLDLGLLILCMFVSGILFIRVKCYALLYFGILINGEWMLQNLKKLNYNKVDSTGQTVNIAELELFKKYNNNNQLAKS